MPQVQITLPEDNDSYGDLAGRALTVPVEAITLGDHLKTASEVNENYVAKSNVEENVKTRLKEQAESLKKSLPQDPEVRRAVLEDAGFEVDEEGQVVNSEGLSDDDLKQKIEEQVKLRRSNWEKEAVDPIRQTAESLSSENDTLKTKLLRLEIQNAAREAGVIKDRFETLPGAPAHTMEVIAQNEHRFGYDEHGNVALKSDDGEGFVTAAEPQPGRPNAGPMQFFSHLKNDEKVAPKWFGAQGPDDRGVGDTTTTSGAGGDNKGGDGGQETREQRLKKLREKQTTKF